MEKPPVPSKSIESSETVPNPNAIFEWGLMPANTDLRTSSENVYRQVKTAGVDDLMASGVVRNAGSAGVGKVRHYGERVYWTRGKDGEFHNVQPDHAVLEAPYAVASARTVTAEDLVGIHTRNEAGVVENTLTTPDSSEKGTEAAPQADSAPNQLSEVRDRLGLGPKE